MPGVEIALPYFHTNRHSLEFPLGHSSTKARCVPRVQANPEAGRLEFVRDDLGSSDGALVILDRDDNDLTAAMRGGTRSPASSPCAMMSPPIMRVLDPQDVVQQVCAAPLASEYVMLKARAKFCPSS